MENENGGGGDVESCLVYCSEKRGPSGSGSMLVGWLSDDTPEKSDGSRDMSIEPDVLAGLWTFLRGDLCLCSWAGCCSGEAELDAALRSRSSSRFLSFLR